MRPFADCVKTTALGHAALKTGSECSFTTRKLVCEPSAFFAGLIRWRSPFGPAFGCYSRWSWRLA
ncbi:hypothetical protein DZC76_07790 [Pseudomonas sp. phDV1]|nr:hypothetical protein DZC76_07790 [Pseudomonas sp. phDV1]PZP84671.1 MAG: hypothetical protein DI578_05565 [Pseudomonas oleovorans]